ncbi:MAG: 6-phosphogluconolactonase [Thermodesulfobacteriota bacterium]
MESIVHRYPDRQAMARAAAAMVAERAAAAVAGCGTCHLALAGGSTPETLYRLLAASPWRETLPWKRMRFFWGDERLVGPDHPDSNFRMAWDAMLRSAPVTAAQLHPVPVAAGAPAEVAVRYGEILEKYARHRCRGQSLLFDLVLLGMGKDGHTASLFPGDRCGLPATATVIAVDGRAASPPLPRVTLTLAALGQCRDVVFLIAGREKTELLERMLADGNLQGYPAGMVRPRGRIDWLLAESE